MKTHKVLVIFLILAPFILSAQKFKPGIYYDVKGDAQTGLLYFRQGNYPLLKFKKNAADPIQKFHANELKAFVIQSDSFAVLSAIHYEYRSGSMHEMTNAIVQVLEKGDISLLKFSLVQGNINYSGRASMPYPLEGFLLTTKNDKYNILTPRKYDDIRLKEQLIQLFSGDTEVINEINKRNIWQHNNLYASIPNLVVQHNTKH